MIVKKRTEPERIPKNKMLLSRLPKTHYKFEIIKEDLAKRIAGYRGELNVDYFLSFLPQDQYYIFCDIRKIHEDKPFQIDTLILSSSYVLILEIKNILGTLFFDKHSNQLTRTINSLEEGFANPIFQAEHQKRQLKSWLAKHNITKIPVICMVVISSPATIIKTTNGNHTIFNQVFHAEQLLTKIKEQERLYNKPHLDKKEIQKLNKLILKAHTPKEEDILELYDLQYNELLTGVQCPKCSYIPMTRIHGTWNCNNCHESSKTAHLQAINDYFIINKTMTNQQCREFLNLKSRHIAKEILQSLKLPSTGKNKKKIYHKPNN